MQQLKFKGKVLIAEPFLEDPNFKRTTVVICDHQTEDGTVGFILNRPLEMEINELVDDFPDFEAEVYFGGPVRTDTIHYIHNVGDLLEGSTKVDEGIFWGGDFDKLKFLIKQELIKPENIRFFVGYSGWGEEQLEGELDARTWLVADLHANYIFKSDPFELWQQVLENKGDTFAVIAQMPDSANLN